MGYGNEVWGFGVKGVEMLLHGGWDAITVQYYYAKNAGEGYFPAMEILHNGK